MLMSFDSLYKISCINKALMGACVKPSEALSEKFNIQGIIFKINSVEVGYFKLASCGRSKIFGIFNNLVVIEIQTSYAVVRLRFFRLFFNRNSLAVLVKFNNAKSFGVINIIPENSSTIAFFRIFNGRL